MILSTILAGAALGELIGGLIVTVAGLSGAAATATTVACTTVGIAGGVAVAASEIATA